MDNRARAPPPPSPEGPSPLKRTGPGCPWAKRPFFWIGGAGEDIPPSPKLSVRRSAAPQRPQMQRAPTPVAPQPTVMTADWIRGFQAGRASAFLPITQHTVRSPSAGLVSPANAATGFQAPNSMQAAQFATPQPRAPNSGVGLAPSFSAPPRAPRSPQQPPKELKTTCTQFPSLRMLRLHGSWCQLGECTCSLHTS